MSDTHLDITGLSDSPLRSDTQLDLGLGEPADFIWDCSQCKTENCGTDLCMNCGSWLCTDCGNLNFSTREKCNRRNCGLPRPDHNREIKDFGFILKFKESGDGGRDRRSGGQGRGGGGKMQSGTVRMGNQAAATDLENGDWLCPKCGNQNYARRIICNRYTCGYVRDAWRCPDCGNDNFPGRFFCNRKSCGLPHPDATDEHIRFQKKTMMSGNTMANVNNLMGGGSNQNMGMNQNNNNNMGMNHNNNNNMGMNNMGMGMNNNHMGMNNMGGNSGMGMNNRGGNHRGPNNRQVNDMSSNGAMNSTRGRNGPYDRRGGGGGRGQQRSVTRETSKPFVADVKGSSNNSMVMQPLLGPDGAPMLINGQQVFTAVPM